MSRIVRPLAALTFVVVAVMATTTAASAATINVSPGTVAPGGNVVLSGDVLAGGSPGCAVPSTVTLISNAFAGLDEFAGVGAVNLPVDASGNFSSTVTLTATVAPGTYTITGRCGGGNLGVQATIVVSGLPGTGPAHPIGPWVCVALCFVGIGLILVTFARRSKRPAA